LQENAIRKSCPHSPHRARAKPWARIDDLEQYLHRYGIADSRERLAHFFAQVLHESGCVRYDMENLNYSAKALRSVFGKYFCTDEEARAYERQPEKIASRAVAVLRSIVCAPRAQATRRSG
jgi:predicted chitinase